MSKYRINIELLTGAFYTYDADRFLVVDSKLEIIIADSVISYDFLLIDGLSIRKLEEIC